MDQFKKTIHITGVETTPHGPKFTYEFNTYDVSKNPDDNLYIQVNQSLFKDKKYEPKANDKIYFFPGCNIPRFKLKEYCSKHKVAPVKFKIRANVVIMGPESYKDLFVLKRDARISWDTFSKFVEDMFPLGDPRTLQLKHDMKDVNENFQYVSVSDDIFEDLTSNTTPFGVMINIPLDENSNPVGYDSHFIQVKDEASYDILKEITAPNSKYFGQDDILIGLNTGVIMDQEIYETIKDSFNSPDVENHKVAMAFMANVDYRESAVYIMLLIREFGNKIYNVKNKDHVNFKSMLTYFGVPILHLNLNDIIDSLLKKKLLTRANLNLILPFVRDEMTATLRYTHLFCEQISFSQAVLDALKEDDEQNPPEEITAGFVKQTVEELSEKVVPLGEPNFNL